MTTIKFSDTELKDLKTFYQLELDKANVRVQDIKGILGKLNSRQTTNGQTVNVEQIKTHRTDNPPDDKQKKITVAGSGISPIGRKMGKYPIFILETLERQNKFLKSNQLYDMAYRQFKITDKKEKEKALRNIQGHLLRMSRRKEIIARLKKGERDKLYGLISWTDKK